jgi:hypothetical protein
MSSQYADGVPLSGARVALVSAGPHGSSSSRGPGRLSPSTTEETRQLLLRLHDDDLRLDNARPLVTLSFLDVAKKRRLGQREHDDFLACRRTNVVMQA